MPLAIWRHGPACPHAEVRIRGVCSQVACGHRPGDVWLSDRRGEGGQYVLFARSPLWEEGMAGEREVITATCHRAVQVVQEMGCKSFTIQMDELSAFGCPSAMVQRLVINGIRDSLRSRSPDNDMMVYLVTAGRLTLPLPLGLRSYVRENVERGPRRRLSSAAMSTEQLLPRARAVEAATLEDALETLDESFSQMVVRKLVEKGMTSADCYHRANIDRRLFSKIVNNVDYRPGKTTALALAVALELPLEETRELLMKAGLALSHSHKLDVIVEFFIRQGQFDLFAINEALFSFSQPLLGDVRL